MDIVATNPAKIDSLKHVAAEFFGSHVLLSKAFEAEWFFQFQVCPVLSLRADRKQLPSQIDIQILIH